MVSVYLILPFATERASPETRGENPGVPVSFGTALVVEFRRTSFLPISVKSWATRLTLPVRD